MTPKILITVLFIILCAQFYHLGGQIRSWMRDWICPIFSLGIVYILRPPAIFVHYATYIAAYALMGFALTTYWDWVTRIWRGDESEYFENWLLHGFFCELAAMPLVLCGISYKAILIAAVICAIGMAAISEFSKDVRIEEYGRGAMLALGALIFALVR